MLLHDLLITCIEKEATDELRFPFLSGWGISLDLLDDPRVLKATGQGVQEWLHSIKTNLHKLPELAREAQDDSRKNDLEQLAQEFSSDYRRSFAFEALMGGLENRFGKKDPDLIEELITTSLVFSSVYMDSLFGIHLFTPKNREMLVDYFTSSDFVTLIGVKSLDLPDSPAAFNASLLAGEGDFVQSIFELVATIFLELAVVLVMGASPRDLWDDLSVQEKQQLIQNQISFMQNGPADPGKLRQLLENEAVFTDAETSLLKNMLEYEPLDLFLEQVEDFHLTDSLNSKGIVRMKETEKRCIPRHCMDQLTIFRYIYPLLQLEPNQIEEDPFGLEDMRSRYVCACKAGGILFRGIYLASREPEILEEAEEILDGYLLLPGFAEPWVASYIFSEIIIEVIHASEKFYRFFSNVWETLHAGLPVPSRDEEWVSFLSILMEALEDTSFRKTFKQMLLKAYPEWQGLSAQSLQLAEAVFLDPSTCQEACVVQFFLFLTDAHYQSLLPAACIMYLAAHTISKTFPGFVRTMKAMLDDEEWDDEDEWDEEKDNEKDEWDEDDEDQKAVFLKDLVDNLSVFDELLNSEPIADIKPTLIAQMLQEKTFSAEDIERLDPNEQNDLLFLLTKLHIQQGNPDEEDPDPRDFS